MYYESNELTHYGVKGMKWGQRRYGGVVSESGRFRKKYKPNTDESGSYRSKIDPNKNRRLDPNQPTLTKAWKASVNARKAAAAAKKESIANDRAKGGVTIRKAGINARKAAAEASKQSWAKDKEHNRKLREQEKNNPEAQARKETAKKVAKGAAVVGGTVLVAIGGYKASKLIMKSNRKTDALQRETDRLVSEGREAIERFNKLKTFIHNDF